MTMLKTSVLIVLCMSCITIDAAADCDSEDHVYHFIHLPDGTNLFSVNTNLDFASSHVHFLFTSIFSNSVLINITMEKEPNNTFIFTVTSKNENETVVQPTLFGEIAISYENGHIKFNSENGSLIFQSQTSIKPRYFWYHNNLQTAGCRIGLDEQCSVEHSGPNATQPFEVNCTLTECTWKINGSDTFEKCGDNCTHTIANCTEYLKLYGNISENQNSENTPSVPSNPPPVPMITKGNEQMQTHDTTEAISTANMELSELHVTTQYTTSGDQIENTNTIGDHDPGVNDLETVETTVTGNTDNSVSFRQQVTDVMHTEYHSSGLGMTTVSDTTTVTGIMTTDIGNGSDTNERATKNAVERDDSIEAGIRWTTGIMMLVIFTGAVVSTFVIGCLCVLHGLLKPRARRKISPEETMMKTKHMKGKK